MSSASGSGGPFQFVHHLRLGQKVTLTMLASCLPLVILGIQVANIAGGLVKGETLKAVELAAEVEANRIDSEISRAAGVLQAAGSDAEFVKNVAALSGAGRNEANRAIRERLDQLRQQTDPEGSTGIALAINSTLIYPDAISYLSPESTDAGQSSSIDTAVWVSPPFADDERGYRVSIIVTVNQGAANFRLVSEWKLETLLYTNSATDALNRDADRNLLLSNPNGTNTVLWSDDPAYIGQLMPLDANPTAGNPQVSETAKPDGAAVVRATARSANIGWIVVIDTDPSVLFAKLGRVRLGIIGVFISAGLVIISVIAVLLRSFVQRLARMTELAEAVADGDLTVRTGDERFDELGRLSMAFDDMTEALAQDIARRERVEAQLAYQATHDALTGLPNRQQLIEELDRLMVESEDLVSVLFVDLDGFKAVNDRLGHGAGDELLVRVGDRLRGVLRPSDFVARLGGDEFVVVLRGLGLLEAERLAERIVAALELPFIVSNDEAQISASIGVSSASDDRSTERLIKEADIAMYRAKAMGKGRAVRVTNETLAANEEHLSILNELREATSNGQLELLLWPIADLRDGALRGLESTVRWRHPERGLLAPAEFMPMAKATGTSGQIDEWVITASIATFAKWAEAGLPVSDLEMAINLTTEMFLSSRSRQLISGELERHKLRPSNFRIEVPEDVLRSDGTVLRQVFDTYRAMGMPVTLDRFGSDYANLDRLPRFAIDAVKVDLNLIADLSNRLSSRALVSSLITLAKTAGLRVAAAGVDDDLLREEVLELGCTTGQGMWLSQAVSPEEPPKCCAPAT
ncbi:MAG: EAL domain-containing protein [Acidimicrobiales bacterium]